MSNPVIHSNGDKIWYDANNRMHRDDGPAVIYSNGTNFWYHHGLTHRLDGPAIENNVLVIKYWYYRGNYINCSSQQEFEKFLKLRAFW